MCWVNTDESIFPASEWFSGYCVFAVFSLTRHHVAESHMWHAGHPTTSSRRTRVSCTHWRYTSAALCGLLLRQRAWCHEIVYCVFVLIGRNVHIRCRCITLQVFALLLQWQLTSGSFSWWTDKNSTILFHYWYR